jgi:hypothetical protein
MHDALDAIKYGAPLQPPKCIGYEKKVGLKAESWRRRSARVLISNERHKGMHDGRGDAGEWRLAEASSRNTPAASHYSALRLLIGYTPRAAAAVFIYVCYVCVLVGECFLNVARFQIYLLVLCIIRLPFIFYLPSRCPFL